MNNNIFDTTGMTDTQIAITCVAMGLDLATVIGSFGVTKKILKNLAGNTSKSQNLGINGMSFYIAAKMCGSMPFTNLVNGIFKVTNNGGECVYEEATY